MMKEWLKGEQRKILFPQYKEEDVFMLEEFVNYLDTTAGSVAEQSVQADSLPDPGKHPDYVLFDEILDTPEYCSCALGDEPTTTLPGNRCGICNKLRR